MVEPVQCSRVQAGPAGRHLRHPSLLSTAAWTMEPHLESTNLEPGLQLDAFIHDFRTDLGLKEEQLEQFLASTRYLPQE